MNHPPAQSSINYRSIGDGDDDDDWAEFASFRDHVSVPTPPPTVQLTSNPNPIPISSSPPAYVTSDDEFGDFQSSSSSTIVPCQLATPPTVNPPSIVDVVPDVRVSNSPCGKLAPNYYLNEDLETFQSPADVIRLEWSKCLSCIVQVMQQTAEALSSLVTDDDRAEFGAVDEGSGFLQDVAEVFAIVCRVRASASQLGIADPQFNSQLDTIRRLFAEQQQYALNPKLQILWDSLLCDSQRAIVLQPHQPTRTARDSALACGVCLAPFLKDNAAQQPVAHAGRSYHLPCANFWINRVQLSLPALIRPE